MFNIFEKALNIIKGIKLKVAEAKQAEANNTNNTTTETTDTTLVSNNTNNTTTETTDTTLVSNNSDNKVEEPKKENNPKYEKLVVFLTPGHTNKTPGKCSPDGKLQEWKYNRIIVKKIEQELDELGIEHWNSHPESGWVSENYANDSKDLTLRVKRINTKYKEVKEKGKKAIMLSIHVNAAGNGGWYNATGWSAWTTKGQNNSDKLADCLYDAAEEVLTPLGKKIRKDLTDGDRDYEANFYVIKHSDCISVLTENFFMDNKEDMAWLLSAEGMNSITKLHIEGIKKYIDKYIH